MPTKSNSAFMKPVNISPELEAVVGKGPMPRSEITKKIWEYIKKNNLQDEKDRRNINADDQLKKVFGGKGQIGMMQMAKHVSANIIKD